MLGDSIKKFALSQAFSYIEKDPIKNLTQVMDMVDKFAGDGPQSFPRQRQAIRHAINNEDSTALKLVLRMMTEMDLGFTETLLSNLFLNASITGCWLSISASTEPAVSRPPIINSSGACSGRILSRSTPPRNFEPRLNRKGTAASRPVACSEKWCSSRSQAGNQALLPHR